MGVKSARRPNSDSKRRRGQTTGGRTKLPPPSSRGVGGEGRCYPKELHGHQAEPLLLNHLMISPTRPRCTPSGLMAMKVHSRLAMVRKLVGRLVSAMSDRSKELYLYF